MNEMNYFRFVERALIVGLGEFEGTRARNRTTISSIVCIKEKTSYSLGENVIERKDEESESLIRTPGRVAGRIRT